MISKSRFVECFDYILKLREKEEALNEGLIKCFGGGNVGDAFVYSDVETHFIQLLCDAMDVEFNGDAKYGDCIQYFIYELDFGKEAYRALTPTSSNVYVVESAEELYDRICENKGKQSDGCPKCPCCKGSFARK